MEFQDSSILKASISKLLPFVIVYSIYIFSFGANYPGGGFQAGLVCGTIIIIWEIIFNQKIFKEILFQMLEFFGIFIVFLSMVFGLIYSGVPFSGLYGFQSSNLISSNLFIWVLNFAIFIKILSAFVMLFRVFLDLKE